MLTPPRSAQIDAGWHAWISYMVDKSPAEDPVLQTKHRPWEKEGAIPNYTGTRGAFKTYSTWVSPLPLLPKCTEAQCPVAERFSG